MYAGGHFFIEAQRKHLLQAISAQLRLSTPDQALAG
jgi:surfactin synthase thioesterase subunit